MSSRGMRRPAPFSTDAGRPLDVGQPAPPSAAPVVTKFTALLETADDDRFGRITAAVGRQAGRIAGRRGDARGGRYPARADALRAMLALVDDDPDLLARVSARVVEDIMLRRQNGTT
jgi:hypothetical protein